MDLNFKARKSRASPASDFTGPKALAQDHQRAVFRREDGAKEISGISGVVSVHAAPRQLIFEGKVSCFQRPASTNAESLSFKALEELRELFSGERGNDNAPRRGFAELDFPRFAELAQAVEMAEEVERPNFGAGNRGNNTAPDLSGFSSARRLLILALDQIQTDGANIRSKVEGLDFENEHLLACRRGESGESFLKF